MKLMILAALLIGAVSFSIDEKSELNKSIDERVKINKEYLEENIKLHKDADNEKEWVETEKKSTAAMVELLEYCKKSDDLKLKRLVLLNEFYMELVYQMDEKEFAESDEDKAAAMKQIDKIKNQIASLEKGSN